MYRRIVLSFVALTMVSLSFADYAEARRRVRFRVGPRLPRRFWADQKTHFYVGLGGLLNYTVKEEDRSQLTTLMEQGGGFNAVAGLRFNRFFAAEAGYMASIHSTDAGAAETYSALLHGVTLDGKFFLDPRRNHQTFDPFLQAGFGGYGFLREGFGETELAGAGLHVGGGFDLYLSKAFSIGARALYKGIFMDNAGDTFGGYKWVFLNHLSLEANLQIHF